MRSSVFSRSYYPTLSAAAKRMATSTTSVASRPAFVVASPAVQPLPLHPHQHDYHHSRLLLRSSLVGDVVASPATQNRVRPFSTAAAAVEADVPPFEQQEQQQPQLPPKNKKKRSLLQRADALKDPLVVTSRAADRIRELLQGESAKGAIGIRLGVRRRGCNGLSYTLNYAYDNNDNNNGSKNKNNKDVQMEAHGIKVFIEPMALFNIVGTTMDWEESELTSEFTFKNPNSKGECGCGESFTV